ncbi:MAG: hypothetical protein K2G87_06070, partial [Oscillospiraceae bacterium]|nr:hypothetical protein [Oscillospiraceae bacterium]
MNGKISKFTAAVLSALMCASLLSGCNKDSENSEDPGSSPAGTEQAAVENASADTSSAVDVTGGFINSDWTYGQVSVGGGGFITGVFSTPEEGVWYTRTDVGGAYYRTPETDGKWASMNYWVTSDDKGLLGIDGLAYDPQAPNKVYLLMG